MNSARNGPQRGPPKAWENRRSRVIHDGSESRSDSVPRSSAHPWAHGRLRRRQERAAPRPVPGAICA
ncbi:MAG: hypothetical protein MZV70_22420 [Desulfobacterales bacterium]|nr:hypothetical protein [Desulfobacterales bacterium]